MLQSRNLSRLLTQALSDSVLLSSNGATSPLAISLITEEGELVCSYFAPGATAAVSVSQTPGEDNPVLLQDDLKLYAILIMDAFRKQAAKSENTPSMELAIDSYTLLVRRAGAGGLFTLMVVAKDFPTGYAVAKLARLNTELESGLGDFKW